MITEHLQTEPINLRILSDGLFQPVLHLNLQQHCSGLISGTAIITLKELTGPLNLSFKVLGSYQNHARHASVSLQLKGHKLMDSEQNPCLFLNLEMNTAYTTGICNYHYHSEVNKYIRNATVSSILFATTPSKKLFSIADIPQNNQYALL
ncbi:DUF1842 domain-containing protein [Pedobacter sp. PLR]|uniref:DUF1842 domain-containing protein n=1 Tax=Pedobacter sp. PLR TaxID=2994465 RepID=UPI0022478571|nr:DUF1842 domain-containing protein [Pedobacter sp. PLR]MCX2453431.1 DUF1842 domain-containing protein [Pedobacter sp. PLR]